MFKTRDEHRKHATIKMHCHMHALRLFSLDFILKRHVLRKIASSIRHWTRSTWRRWRGSSIKSFKMTLSRLNQLANKSTKSPLPSLTISYAQQRTPACFCSPRRARENLGQILREYLLYKKKHPSSTRFEWTVISTDMIQHTRAENFHTALETQHDVHTRQVPISNLFWWSTKGPLNMLPTEIFYKICFLSKKKNQTCHSLP